MAVSSVGREADSVLVGRLQVDGEVAGHWCIHIVVDHDLTHEAESVGRVVHCRRAAFHALAGRFLLWHILDVTCFHDKYVIYIASASLQQVLVSFKDSDTSGFVPSDVLVDFEITSVDIEVNLPVVAQSESLHLGLDCSSRQKTDREILHLDLLFSMYLK